MGSDMGGNCIYCGKILKYVSEEICEECKKENMRNFNEKELKEYNKHLSKISKPTGETFYDKLKHKFKI